MADMPSWLTAWLSPWNLLAVCIYSVLCWAGRYVHRYMHLPFYSILALVWPSVTHLWSTASKDQKWRQWLDVHCVLSVHTGLRMVAYTYSKVPICLQTGTTPCKWEPASQAAILFGVNQWYLCLSDWWCIRWSGLLNPDRLRLLRVKFFKGKKTFWSSCPLTLNCHTPSIQIVFYCIELCEVNPELLALFSFQLWSVAQIPSLWWVEALEGVPRPVSFNLVLPYYLHWW